MKSVTPRRATTSTSSKDNYALTGLQTSGKLKLLVEAGLEIRDYQQEIVGEIIENFPDQRVLMHLPWGAGKTIVALLIVAELRTRNILKPKELVIYTSGGAGGADRCRQALEMTKRFLFTNIVGYCAEPAGLPLSIRKKIYSTANMIFMPVGSFSNDLEREEIRSKIIDRCKLTIVDEAGDIAARHLDTFRISVPYFYFLRILQDMPIIGLTAIRNQNRLKFITDALQMQTTTLEIPGFKYETFVVPVIDSLIEVGDLLLTRMMYDCVRNINFTIGLEGPNRLRLDLATELVFGGVLNRLEKSIPFTIRGRDVAENRSDLIVLFSVLHKLSYCRLLLLESTPSSLASYLEEESTFIELPSVNNPTDNQTSIFIPLIASEELWCGECAGPILTKNWCFMEQKTQEIRDRENCVLKCRSCMNRMAPTQSSVVIERLKKRNSTKSSRMPLSREWRDLRKAIEMRLAQTTLAGKVLTAVPLLKRLIRNKKRIVIFCRYRALAIQLKETLIANGVERIVVLTGKTSVAVRTRKIHEFKRGKLDTIILTQIGARGLDLIEAGVVMHLDITASSDEMFQRRERIRGGDEYIILYESTSEEKKLRRSVPDYEDLIVTESF